MCLGSASTIPVPYGPIKSTGKVQPASQENNLVLKGSDKAVVDIAAWLGGVRQRLLCKRAPSLCCLRRPGHPSTINNVWRAVLKELSSRLSSLQVLLAYIVF